MMTDRKVSQNSILLTFSLLSAVLLTACGPLSEAEAADRTATALTATAASWTQTASLTSTFTPTLTFTPTSTDTPTETSTPTSTASPTETATATITPTPTKTATATIAPSPTFDFPKFTVLVQAHCRYGPAKAYLHAADLFPGDKGLIWGRYYNSNWLLIKPDKITYPCWVSPSVIEITGDIKRLMVQEPRLPQSTIPDYGPPERVVATRQGDKVTVSWEAVYMTADDDRGYMLDVFVCQDGNYLWWPVSLDTQYQTSYTFTDQAGCSQPSGGRIATVEKHGYTSWVDIPWPP